MDFNYNSRLIILTLSGSRAYGTWGPTSDYDYRGVIIPPTKIYKSCLHNFEQKEGLQGYGSDSTGYDIKKFVKLAMDNNPNILEILFSPDHLLQVIHPLGQRLRDKKHLFLSKKARHTLSGYAFAQLKRMKQHKAWWDKELAGEVPPKPIRAEFDLPEVPKYPKDMLNQLMTIPNVALEPSILEYISKERDFHEDKRKYDSWYEWKNNRNADRYLLEELYGFDGKHAMHLVRLMKMCEEILTTGELIIERPDAELLKSIKTGAWTFDYIVKWAEDKDIEMNELYAKSTLQKEPRRNEIDELLIDIITEAEKMGW